MMSVFAWLVTYLIHSTILLLLALVVDHFFLSARPHLKEMVWRVALVGGLITATAQSVLPWRPYGGTVVLSGLEERNPSSFVNAPPVGAIVIREMHSPRTVVISRSMNAAQPPLVSKFTQVFPWRAALGAWGVGAVALLAALGLSWNGLRKRLEGRRRLESEPIGDILAALAARRPVVRAPLISSTEDVTVPMALGLRRPEIVLPERVALELSRRAQESVLAHELGHIVRRDPLHRLWTAILVRVFFFQPLNFVAARQLAAAAELLADDWAAERTARPLDLAECLTRVARWAISDTPSALAPAMAREKSELRQRVERLVKGEWLPMRTRKTVWSGPIATFLLTAMYLLAPSASGVAEAKDKVPPPPPVARRHAAPPAPPTPPVEWADNDAEDDQDEPCEAREPNKRKQAERQHGKHPGTRGHGHLGRGIARFAVPPVPPMPSMPPVVVTFDDADFPEPPEPPEPPELGDLNELDVDVNVDMSELEENMQQLHEQMAELRSQMRQMRKKAVAEALEGARTAMKEAKRAQKQAEKAREMAKRHAEEAKRRTDDDDDDEDGDDDDDE